MFKCPVCGAVARTRTSRPLSEMTVRHYHQCQNFECSITFTTLNSVEKLVTKRAPAKSYRLISSHPMLSRFALREGSA
jgi:transcriptional regulator NrdR family protein